VEIACPRSADRPNRVHDGPRRPSAANPFPAVGPTGCRGRLGGDRRRRRPPGVPLRVGHRRPGGGRALGSTPVSSDASTAPAQVDSSSAIVTLTGDPLSTAASTRPPRGKKIDFSSSAVKAERARLSALRNDFKTWLRANAPAASVVKEYDTALNAVVVQLNGTALATLRGAPQVTDAQHERLYAPSDANDPDLA